MITNNFTTKNDPDSNLGALTNYSNSIEEKKLESIEPSINKEHIVSNQQVIPRAASSSSQEATHPKESPFSSASIATIAPEIPTVIQNKTEVMTAAKNAIAHFIKTSLPEVRNKIEQEELQASSSKEATPPKESPFSSTSITLQVTGDELNPLTIENDLKRASIKTGLKGLEFLAKKCFLQIRDWLKKEAALNEELKKRYSLLTANELIEAKESTNQEEDLNAIEHYSFVMCVPDILNHLPKELSEIEKTIFPDWY